MPDAKTPRNVVEAIATVMSEVTMIGKTGYNSHQKFPFRGIDGTVNVIGPVMRKYGLIMVPEVQVYDYGAIKAGKAQTDQGHAKVTVKYTFHYSNADGEVSTLPVAVPGESMDSGDKATAKAMSVAWRTALLQTFVVPTMEPDPDEYTVGGPDADDVPTGPPVVTLDQVLNRLDEKWDDADAILGVYNVAGANNLLDELIVDKHTGETDVPLGTYIVKRGKALKDAAGE